MDSFDTTLRIIQGDGGEYTDNVLITFTRDWDHSLTRTHNVSWQTFEKALALIENEEALEA